MFFNLETGKEQWEHPSDERFRQLYQQHKRKKQGAKNIGAGQQQHAQASQQREALIKDVSEVMYEQPVATEVDESLKAILLEMEKKNNELERMKEAYLQKKNRELRDSVERNKERAARQLEHDVAAIRDERKSEVAAVVAERRERLRSEMRARQGALFDLNR